MYANANPFATNVLTRRPRLVVSIRTENIVGGTFAMRSRCPERPFRPRSHQSSIPSKLAGILACLPVLYVLWLQFSPHKHGNLFVLPDALPMFLFTIFMPGVLLWVCVRISGVRTAWICLTALLFFVAIDFWLFSVGGGLVAPGVALGELIIGGVLLPIAVATGDRRTGL